MAFVELHPLYSKIFSAIGLKEAEDFLRLSGEIYCGHPDRNVARVGLGGTAAYLKREHCVRWRDRLGSAWAGFGLASKSYREYRLLRALAAAGVGCPEPLAVGETSQGQAFLLVRAVDDGMDLREFLQRHEAEEHRDAAVRLGIVLARLHAAGVDHPDLYSKHVLVRRERERELEFCILDWQRSRSGQSLSWNRRWRDLAALEATLAEDMAGSRDRLACLRAYLRETHRQTSRKVPRLGRAARAVRARSLQLLRRRRIREMQRLPLARGQQNLIWLDGEKLCVTRQFFDEVGGDVPSWVRVPEPTEGDPNQVWRQEVPRASGRWLLVRRRSSRPLMWLASVVMRRRFAAREVELAGALFRLERYGIVAPRLLAVGQCRSRGWRIESMLLTEPIPGAVALSEWLEGAPVLLQREVMAEAEGLLRRLHEAGYGLFHPDIGSALAVREGSAGARVVLAEPEALRRVRGTLPSRYFPDRKRPVAELERCGP